MGDEKLVRHVAGRMVKLASGLVPPEVVSFDRANPPQDGALLALLEELPGVTFTRVLGDISRSELDELVKRAERNDPTYRAPDFLSYWFVDTTDGVDSATHDAPLTSDRHKGAILRTLLSRNGRPPAVDPSDDSGWTLQFALHDAPMGTGAMHAWKLTSGQGGGDGAGVSFADVEAVLPLVHTGLPMNKIQTAGQSGPVAPGEEDHATAVLGIVVAMDDDSGMVGAAPNTDNVFVVSNFIRGRFNTAFAVIKAAKHLNPGDVLLVEFEIVTPAEDADGNPISLGVPAECDEVTYHAVRLATALGIVVVAAAGNGDGGDNAANLDTLAVAPGVSLNPQSPLYRDSGAILVSAAKWDLSDLQNPVNRRMDWAPYGGRIDCYARGEGVMTCRGQTDPNTGNYLPSSSLVSESFSGTSAAAAIIAATAIQVQGIAKQIQGRPLSPKAMREMLSNPLHGTAAAPERPDRPIGVMPDLRKLIKLGLGPIA